MEALNEFELAILERLSAIDPAVKKHVPYLRAKLRKHSGDKTQVHFTYAEGSEALDYIKRHNLSATGYLKMEGLQDGLIDNTTITNGRIDFLELVTYAEDWDGTIRPFHWDDKL